MDAYDHIQEEQYPDDVEKKEGDAKRESTLNTEFQETFKAFSNSPWGTKLGGLWGTVKKQSETYISTAQAEYNTASTTASKGISDLITRTRALSQPTTDDASSSKDAPPPQHPAKPESLTADIAKEASTIFSSLRLTATQKLAEIEKVEDAADEAILRFGSNIRDMLRNAVTITPPVDDASAPGGQTQGGQVLFESKDSEGKRVIHTTRFEAQLHVIHSSLDSFLKDPKSPVWEEWNKDFDVEAKTAEIAKDLEKYEELRRAMEKCVPERIEYKTFWARYYFLRHVVETEEKRRRELLKGASALPTDEPSWDEDSDSDQDDHTATPNPRSSTTTLQAPVPETSSTPTPPSQAKPAEALKPDDKDIPGRRRSGDQLSQPDSDASYDLVSGATSRAPGSPREEKTRVGKVDEESDEEDWE
ncbi:BSD domain protein [Aulographum hederae CBS 113979]|uniref:BSD domain protein n=1 Tax=Aulographum hederae CBS 113979 TaxID=1176131 RepID=A0A6G1GKR2_9PEZI|nr:BSD domain protein [Aulographum hederae CBS 113979]